MEHIHQQLGKILDEEALPDWGASAPDLHDGLIRQLGANDTQDQSIDGMQLVVLEMIERSEEAASKQVDRPHPMLLGVAFSEEIFHPGRVAKRRHRIVDGSV